MFEELLKVADYLRDLFGQAVVITIKPNEEGALIETIVYVQKEGETLQIGVAMQFKSEGPWPETISWASQIAEQLDSEIEKALGGHDG